jgi:colicin import membrane protein
MKQLKRNFNSMDKDIHDEKSAKGHLIAAAINAAITAHDADTKRADAEPPKEEKRVEEAKADDSGEVLNKVLAALDAIGKRMDGYDAKHDADDAKRKKDAEEKDIKAPGDPEEMKVDSSRADSEANLNELGAIQLRADTASAAWGNRIPTPWTNERAEDYLRRAALLHKSHSPAWAAVNLRELKGKALQNAAEQIFSDSEIASRSGDCAGVGNLRVVTRRDPVSGHVIRESYGDPMAWMSRFTGGRRLAKFNTKAGNGGQ